MRRQQQQQRHPFSPSLLSGATQSQSQDDNNNAVMAISAQEADDRAKALEQQLAQLETSTEGAKNKKSSSSSSKNDQANALRVQICELLADLMLTDPLHASQHSVMERMWRKCFYVRISHLRAKLAAYKRKQKHPSNESSSASTSSSIAALEQHLVFFLGEAIVLYTYLVEKLEEKLVGWVQVKAPISSSRSIEAEEEESDEDDDDVDDDDANAPSQARAAVECLHRLYICLGDLHRYTATATSTSSTTSTANPPPTNNRAALASYGVSAQLGPGMGHPANQLGVMCGSQILAVSNVFKSSSSSTTPTSQHQQQNQSAVGLYWYARSLLASHEPFETTFVNLQRLFQANQLWLDRNQQQQQQQQQQQSHQPPASTVAASKSLQASLFLAQYVQFHGQLLLSGDESSFLSSNDVVANAMEGVTHGLASLLKQSALSDSLLVKAVAIQAFTESYGTTSASANNRSDGIPRTVSVAMGATTTTTTTEPNPTLALRRLWGRVSTLRMGTVLADRILSTLQQRSQQQQQQTYASAASATAAAPSVPTVRLLLPLMLLTEYVRHTTAELESTTLRSIEVSSSGLRETYRTCSHDLWEKVAQILNVIGPMVPAELAASIVAANRNANASPARFLPAEYLSLRGYTPFASFIPQGKGSGFLPPRHAVQVLREEKASAASAPPTQDTAPQAAVGGAASGAGKASHESNRIKLVSRFWMVGRELAGDDSSSETLRGFQRNGDGRFAYEAPTYENLQPMDRADEPNKMVEDSGDEDDDGGDTLNVLMDDDPVVVEDKQATVEGSDGVLVYKAGSVGGPALLVPGALLANAATVEDTIVAPSVPPFATTPLPLPALTGMAGVDLGWLNGPNPQVPIGTIATNRTSEPMEVDRAYVFESLAPPLPQPPAVIGDHFLGAIAASAMTAPSVNDAAQPSTVLPPPGFGTLARSFALDDAQLPTQPPRELSILEASGRLFGALPHTANPFVTMPPPPSYPFPPQPPQGFAATHPPQPMFPHHSNLWMAQDILGGDETYETSLLDSGLLNSLLNDDAAATTKNPFAT
jgi:Telomerase activating protein Est1/Est1 DNA/RNA binding domain